MGNGRRISSSTRGMELCQRLGWTCGARTSVGSLIPGTQLLDPGIADQSKQLGHCRVCGEIAAEWHGVTAILDSARTPLRAEAGGGGRQPCPTGPLAA